MRFTLSTEKVRSLKEQDDAWVVFMPNEGEEFLFDLSFPLPTEASGSGPLEERESRLRTR